MSMRDLRRRARWSVLALVVAIAGAGLVGYVVSRPSTSSRAFEPSPPPSSPPAFQGATYGYSVVGDPSADQVVFFGGSDANDSTWIWSGAHWRRANPTVSPAARLGAAASYDPDLRMVFLFGGTLFPLGHNADDTWGWDGQTWRLLDDGETGPPAGAGASMVWDPAVGEMVLVTRSPSSVSSAGQTWTWTGGRWQREDTKTPFPAPGLVLGFDPLMHTLIGVSCYQLPTGIAVTQTWLWDRTGWRQLATPVVPGAYALLGVGWDPKSHSQLLSAQEFEGSSVMGSTVTWRLVGGKWVFLPLSLGPPVVDGDITQAASGSLLLVGALDGTAGPAPSIHIWAWTGSTWIVTA